MGSELHAEPWFDRAGVLEAVLRRQYTGDSTFSRVIDLGAAYDEVRVRTVTAYAANADHPIEAYDSRGGARGAMYRSTTVQQSTGGSTGAVWGGFYGATSIRLGTSGGEVYGFNRTAVVYEIIAYKYRRVRA